MSCSLPTIGRKASSTDAGASVRGTSNTLSPAAVAAADPAVTAAIGSRETSPFGTRLQRTVQRVCGAAISQEGYIKMLQGVRQRFLESSTPNPYEQLPLIVSRHGMPTKGSTRFSDGLGRVRLDLEQLLVSEIDEREHILSTEAWGRRVVHEMMVVSYVTFVLRQELDELQHSEQEQRGNIRFAEERDWYWLQNESDMSVQLAREKAALRAREEKRLRLEAQERLYPKSRPKAPHPPPSVDQDTRTILQRYVRLKHATDMVLPPIKEAPRVSDDLQTNTIHSSARKTLGIASYVTLLDRDSEARRFIAESEQGAFDEIGRQFREDLAVVWAWQHKRMHLERLVYWRTQREERLKREAAEQEERERYQNVAKKRSQTDSDNTEDDYIKVLHALWATECVEEEYEGRDAVLHQESIARVNLESCCKLNGSRCSEITAIAQTEYKERMAIFLGAESDARAAFVTEWECCVRTSSFDDKASQLRRLENFIPHMREIALLQRALQQWRSGRLGWRYTHREVGRIIAAQRDKKKIERGTASLAAFRASLMKDCNALEMEIQQSHSAKREEIFEQEAERRRVLVTMEGMDWLAAGRTARINLMESVTLPSLAACVASEVNDRREIDVTEEFRRGTIANVSENLVHLIKTKRLTELEERGHREGIVRAEGHAFCELLGLELDERELLRLTAREKAIMQAEERENLTKSLLNEKEIAQQSHEARMNDLMYRYRLGVVEIVAYDATPREAMWNSYSTALMDLLQTAALEYMTALTSNHLKEHATLMFDTRYSLFFTNEMENRHTIVKDESEARLIMAQMFDEERSAELRQVMIEYAAATTIQSFYKAYRAGDVGCAGTRKFLRARYAHKSEILELKQKMSVQRESIRAAEAELDLAIREGNAVRAASIQAARFALVEKTEPRAREELEKLENIVFSVMLRNLCSAVGRWEEDQIAVLWQLESYERVGIMQEWRRVFELVFQPKKATFVEDIMASKIQRCWRCFLARERQLVMLQAALQKLLRDEATERAELETQELIEFALNVVKPMTGCAMLRSYLLEDVPKYLDHMFYAVDFKYFIEEDEWRNRMLLLWRMRQHHFISTVTVEEEVERIRVEQQCFYDGVAQVELIDEETTERQLLENERLYFLLRMLVKEERESRAIIALDFDRMQVELRERKERRRVWLAYFKDCMNFILLPMCSDKVIALSSEQTREYSILIALHHQELEGGLKDPEPQTPQEKLETEVKDAETLEASDGRLAEENAGEDNWYELEVGSQDVALVSSSHAESPPQLFATEEEEPPTSNALNTSGTSATAPDEWRELDPSTITNEEVIMNESAKPTPLSPRLTAQEIEPAVMVPVLTPIHTVAQVVKGEETHAQLTLLASEEVLPTLRSYSCALQHSDLAELDSPTNSQEKTLEHPETDLPDEVDKPQEAEYPIESPLAGASSSPPFLLSHARKTDDELSDVLSTEGLQAGWTFESSHLPELRARHDESDEEEEEEEEEYEDEEEDDDDDDDDDEEEEYEEEYDEDEGEEEEVEVEEEAAHQELEETVEGDEEDGEEYEYYYEEVEASSEEEAASKGHEETTEGISVATPVSEMEHVGDGCDAHSKDSKTQVKGAEVETESEEPTNDENAEL